MQLKLRVGLLDTLTIDVKPTDTFQDLSERLYSLGGVKVDLTQLQKSHDKPFTMATNVIDYFYNSKDTPTEDNGKSRRLCRLCSQVILTDPIYLFKDTASIVTDEKVTLIEKVNASLPIHISVHDHLPKQICETCILKVNNGFEFMKKVVDAQRTLEQVYNVKPKDRPATNYKEEAYCPLCVLGKFRHVDHKLRHVNGQNQTEKILRKEIVVPLNRGAHSGNNKKEPLVSPTVADVPFSIKEEPNEQDLYFEQDNIVTGYWESTQESSGSYMKKGKKRIKNEDDQDWTIDEEYVPVSRRGRPRGTKNKPKIQVPVVEKSCVLCGWLGADVDMYAHAINQHCQPDMGYFPCPICKTNQPNEMHLETHIDRHNRWDKK